MATGYFCTGESGEALRAARRTIGFDLGAGPVGFTNLVFPTSRAPPSTPAGPPAQEGPANLEIMCKPEGPVSKGLPAGDPLPAYALRRWWGAPSAVALVLSIACATREITATALPTFLVCEAGRVGGVVLLPVWWKRAAGRSDHPTLGTQEYFGGQLVSLCLSLYLSGSMLFGFHGHWTEELPFLHANGDNSALCNTLACTMMAYLVHDLVHMLRCWRLFPNWPMLAHHTAYMVLVLLPTAYPQQPPHLYRVGALLITAEASTLLLNSRWILRNVVRLESTSVAVVAVTVCCFLLFVATRIVLHLCIIVDVVRQAGTFAMPPTPRRAYTACVSVAYLINLYWLSSFVQMVLKTNKKNKRATSATAGAQASALGEGDGRPKKAAVKPAATTGSLKAE